MSKRWNSGLLSKTKRGLASLFVCAVVLFPLISFGWLINQALANTDKRSSESLSAFSKRTYDNTTKDPKLFEEPLVSVTFDDGWESIYSIATPLLQKYGINSTQYVLSGTFEDQNYLSLKQMMLMKESGHDLACHSVDHSDLTTQEDEDLDFQLKNCASTLESKLGVDIQDFASPYGHSNTRTLDAIRQNYRSHRDTEGDISNGVNEYDVNTREKFDRYNIIGVTVRRDTPVSQLKEAIDYTIANKGWLVITYHQIDDGPSQYGLDKKLLEEQFIHISNSPIRVVTVGKVMDSYMNRGGR